MPRDLPVIVCANKCDKPRKVTEAEGRQWASAHKFEYYETSAQSGANVDAVFEAVFKKVMARLR